MPFSVALQRGNEKRARLSRHVGVRDAYKGAFTSRVFLGFDGTLELAVQIKGTTRHSAFRVHATNTRETPFDSFRNDASNRRDDSERRYRTREKIPIVKGE